MTGGVGIRYSLYHGFNKHFRNVYIHNLLKKIDNIK